jgi:signal transduction histidine kinase
VDSTIFQRLRLTEGEGNGKGARPGRRLPRLLAVDDDPAILRLIRRTIPAGDCDIALAPDGVEGLRLAIEAPPDLILSDVDMPRMTGAQLLRAVRARPSLQGIPFIALTAIEDDQLRLDLLRAGAQDFLVKPFSVEELRARVANLLQMKLARDYLQQEVDSRSSDVKLLIAEVAERRAAQEVTRAEAQKASQAKSDFLTLVSHELRTPLTVLRFGIDVWRRRMSEGRPPPLDLELRRFSGSVARLEGLVDSLLEAALVQSGRLELHLEEIDVRDLIEQMAFELETQIQAKGLALRIEVTEEARRVRSDRRLLWLIVSNLLHNAIKFTDAGEIEIRVYRWNGTVLEVHDSGQGISEEDTGRIFDPFVQLEDLDHKSTPGMGLGLALVRDLVGALGGQVGVQSSLGVGSTFSVTLPEPGGAPGGALTGAAREEERPGRPGT